MAGSSGIAELKPSAQRLLWHGAAPAEEHRRRHAPPKAGAIPAKNWVRLAPVQAPFKWLWQLQACRCRDGCIGPAQHCHAPIELSVNLRPEMEGEAEIMTAAADLVDDVDCSRRTIQPYATTMPRWRAARGVAVVFSGPLGRIADVYDFDFSSF